MKEGFESEAKKLFGDLGVQFVSCSRFLGGCIGDSEGVQKFVEKKVDAWCRCVEDLAYAAEKFPQSAYCAFVKSLQSEWKFLQRMVPDTSHCYEQLRDTIHSVFIPKLLGRSVSEAELRLFELPTRRGGLGILDPCKAAQPSFEISAKSTCLVKEAIMQKSNLDVAKHSAYYKKVMQAHRAEQEKVLECTFEQVLEELDPQQQKAVRNQVEFGAMAWMNALPLASEGFDLSAQQWRDRVAIQFGKTPAGMPAKCDGCGADFSIPHAMDCLKGGLVKWGHDNLRDVVFELGKLAWGYATSEPVIRDAVERVADGGSDGLRADVLVRGVWETNRDCLFDICIVNADSPGRVSCNTSLKSALTTRVRGKRRTYNAACEEHRVAFTPLACSVDGCFHVEFKAFLKRLAARLSAKWSTPLSVVTSWVTVRMQFALIKAVDLRVRGSRKRWMGRSFEDGAGLGALN